MTIDYEIMIPTYNKKYKTNCLTVKDMMLHCKRKSAEAFWTGMPSYGRMGDILGVSGHSIRNWFKTNGLKLLPKWNDCNKGINYSDNKEKLEDIDTSNMTIREISKIIGKQYQTTGRWLRHNGYPYKRVVTALKDDKGRFIKK